MKGTRTRKARFLLALSLSILLSGCMKVDMDFTLHESNEASGSVIFAIDKRLLDLTGQSVDDVMREADFELPESTAEVSTEPYEDDTFRGQRISFEGMRLSELSSGGTDELSVTREGDEFHVSGILDLGLSDVPADAPGFDQVAQDALDSAEIRVRITFPGDVISANGDIDGRSVTWRPEVGERTEMRAVGSAIAEGSNTLMLVGIGAAIVVAAGAVVVLARRRRPPAEAEPEAGDDDAAPVGASPLPPQPSE